MPPRSIRLNEPSLRKLSHAGGVPYKSEFGGVPPQAVRLNEPLWRRLAHAGEVLDKSEIYDLFGGYHEKDFFRSGNYFHHNQCYRIFNRRIVLVCQQSYIGWLRGSLCASAGNNDEIISPWNYFAGCWGCLLDFVKKDTVMSPVYWEPNLRVKTPAAIAHLAV